MISNKNQLIMNNNLPIIHNILISTLTKITRAHQSIDLYLNLSPFAKIATKHPSQLTTFYQKQLPLHLKTVSTLFHKYRAQPPLISCGLHKPLIVGLLGHIGYTQSHSEMSLKKVLSECS